MSSSTRNLMRKVFGNRLPKNLDPYEIAKIIFAVENPPGHKYISGVVDQLGLCLPGINKLKFDDSHWPYKVEKIKDKNISEWLSTVIYLVHTKERPDGYQVYNDNENFSLKLIRLQSELGEYCWESINQMNINKLGDCINQVHRNQKNMIPGYESREVCETLENIKINHTGVKLMGAGGFGYAMIVTDNPEKNFLKVKVTF